MKLVDLNCPGCGATIKVNQELSRGVCNFCGREFLIDDEVQKWRSSMEDSWVFSRNREGAVPVSHTINLDDFAWD